MKIANAQAELDGLGVIIFRGVDGKLVVQIDGPGDGDLTANETPDIRVYLNDDQVFGDWITGHDRE